jgi:hypothetical protein
MMVKDSGTGTIHIWGADGPKLSFDDPNSFREYTAGFFKRKQYGNVGWFITITLASVASVIGLLVARRRLSHR